MTPFMECIQAAYTEDGIRYSGHQMAALVAIRDVDTERFYYVDACKHCGKIMASFTDGDMPEVLAEYPAVRWVGGEESESPRWEMFERG